MTINKKKSRSGKLIHVRLPEEVHKMLRITAAELDTTIQDWVADLIQKTLQKPSKSNKNGL